MVKENFNQIGISQALTEITALKQQAYVGGNVDSEKDSLDAIANKLTLNLISPEEAIVEAHKIIASRQDYH